MKNIQVNIFDPKSIDKAIKKLNAYKLEVETKTVDLVKKLITNGVSIARVKLVEYQAYYSGELYDDIVGYYSESTNIGYVRVTNDHAAFIEFGTGPRGSASPHPMGGGSYKSEGWYTKADGKPMDAIYGWTPIQLENGDVIYYTEGQPAKPFMYETAKQLENDFIRVAKEVFAK